MRMKASQTPHQRVRWPDMKFKHTIGSRTRCAQTHQSMQSKFMLAAEYCIVRVPALPLMVYKLCICSSHHTSIFQPKYSSRYMWLSSNSILCHDRVKILKEWGNRGPLEQVDQTSKFPMSFYLTCPN